MLKKYRNFILVGMLVAVLIVSQLPKRNDLMDVSLKGIEPTPFDTMYYLNGEEDIDPTVI